MRSSRRPDQGEESVSLLQVWVVTESTGRLQKQVLCSSCVMSPWLLRLRLSEVNYCQCECVSVVSQTCVTLLSSLIHPPLECSSRLLLASVSFVLKPSLRTVDLPNKSAELGRSINPCSPVILDPLFLDGLVVGVSREGNTAWEYTGLPLTPRGNLESLIDVKSLRKPREITSNQHTNSNLRPEQHSHFNAQNLSLLAI